jgi:hypothetical protein
MLMGNMEAFDSESTGFSTYIGRFEQFLSGNNVSADRYLTMLITFGGKEIYETLESILYPVEPSETTYEEAKTQLRNFYQPKSNIMFERFKFYKRDQKESESIADFIKALKQLAKNCEFKDFLKEALRDRLVCGLRSESIQLKLMDQSPQVDFTKACQLALSMETTKSNVATMHEFSAINQIRSKKWNPKKKKEKDKNGKHCKRCGRKNVKHNVEECPALKWKCFACNREGHVSRTCKLWGKKKSNLVKKTETTSSSEEVCSESSVSSDDSDFLGLIDVVDVKDVKFKKIKSC